MQIKKIILSFIIASGGFRVEGAEVNLCQSANQVGSRSDLNLKDAVTQGGAVTFACPSGTVIQITEQIWLTKNILIDGGGKITLDGGGRSRIFTETGQAEFIELQNLKILNAIIPARTFDAPALGTNILGSSVLAASGKAVLRNVEVNNSVRAFEASIIEVIGGKFVNNIDAVISADQILIQGGEQEKVKFENNQGSPFTNRKVVNMSVNPTTPRLAAEAKIESTDFTNNQHVDWEGDLRMSNVNFLNNQATGDSGAASLGGALLVKGRVSIDHSWFIGNLATKGSGGAIFFNGGELELRRVVFNGNKAAKGGGAVSLGSSNNIQIRYSKFSQNEAENGGAIYDTGSSRWLIEASVFNDNLATGNSIFGGGGAIHSLGSGQIDISRSVFAKNRSEGSGSAIYQRHSFTPLPITIVNSLVVANNSNQKLGALTVANATLLNSTVANNMGVGLAAHPDMEWAAFGNGVRFHGNISIRNTVVANNSEGNCISMRRQVTLDNAGKNLQWPGTDCGASITSADPKLDSYFVAAPSSPARGAGDLKTCRDQPVSATDIYGTVRPHGTFACTIGAVEDTVERQATERVLRSDPVELPATLKGLYDHIKKIWGLSNDGIEDNECTPTRTRRC